MRPSGEKRTVPQFRLGLAAALKKSFSIVQGGSKSKVSSQIAVSLRLNIKLVSGREPFSRTRPPGQLYVAMRCVDEPPREVCSAQCGFCRPHCYSTEQEPTSYSQHVHLQFNLSSIVRYDRLLTSQGYEYSLSQHNDARADEGENLLAYEVFANLTYDQTFIGLRSCDKRPTPQLLPGWFAILCSSHILFRKTPFSIGAATRLVSYTAQTSARNSSYTSNSSVLAMISDAESIMMEGDKGGYRQINKSLNICAFDDYLRSQTANLPVLPNVEQLSSRVLRVLGQNAGKFTLQGTNTYIVGTGSHRLLIDTSGGEPEWADLMKQTLGSRGITLSSVLITHFHGDHSGGAPDLVRMYPLLKNSVYKNDPDRDQQNITDGQVFRVEGATVRALHAPGHSTDHMCFILEEEQAMFTGDNILGHGSSAIEDLGVFMTSLQKMLDQSCNIGYTAHGITLSDLAGKIKSELSTKLRRERQIVQALNRVRSRGERSASVQDIVGEIYGISLDEQTRTLALEPFTEEVLRKLAADGKVAFERRSGRKMWYSVEQVAPHRVSSSKMSTLVQVSVNA